MFRMPVIENFGSRIFLFPVDGKDSEKEKLFWIIKMRYHFLVAIVVLFFAGSSLNYLPGHMFLSYFAISSVFLIYSLVTQTFYQKRASEKVTQNTIFLHLTLDLFIFTLFLSLAKGFNNPFLSVFFIHAFMGGMLLDWKIGARFYFLLTLCLGAIQYANLSAPVENAENFYPTVLTQHFVAFASWGIARSLGRHLSYGYARLMKMKLVSEKTDRLRAVGALTAGLSHEFASPLNTVKLRLNRLVRSGLKTEDDDDLSELLLAIEKCETVLRKMNSSQLDSRDFEFEETNISELVANIIEVWGQDHQGAKVSNNISPSIAVKLPRINFAQSILNILDNAYEATPRDSEIAVEAKFLNGDLALHISDNGQGFPEQVIERKGEPFNTSKSQGTGLGIYTTELFMNSIGGSLHVRNRSDRGAEVQLIFPASSIISGVTHG